MHFPGELLKEYGHVDRMFAINNHANLERHWVVADVAGIIHHLDYNQDLLDPRLINGWMQLRNFYRLLGHHHILLGYVAPTSFQLTIFRSDVGQVVVNGFLCDIASTEALFHGQFAHYRLTLTAEVYNDDYLVIYVTHGKACTEWEKWLLRFKKTGYPGSKDWLPIHRMNMCHKTKLNPTHNGSMHQQTTTQHTKGPRPYPWQGHALNGKSRYPGSKNWLPIHMMNMCHKTKPNSTHHGSMHQQTTTQGTPQDIKRPRPYPWQGHALNGKSGYPGSKNWLPIHRMNM